ncbi:MAG: hypothetical protein ABIJ86_03630 [Spirochaetota bacterium]
MNRDYEKTGYANGLADAVLTILAIASVAVVLCSAALAAAGTPWRVRAFFAVVSVLFDLVFVYELMAKASLAIRNPRMHRWTCPGWLLFTSSILPFLLVSGPFLAGWLSADFASAAVRGYAIASPPLGALATIAALRLLRAARPFIPACGQTGNKPMATAAGIGLVVVFLGTILTDGLLLPSWFAAWTAEHESSLQVIADTDTHTARLVVEANQNIKAAIAGGFILKAADPGLMPTDFIALSDGSATLWFDSLQVHKARGMAELVAALAACAAAAVYGFGFSRNRNNSSGLATTADPAHVMKARTTPACVEEIEGILGKPLR